VIHATGRFSDILRPYPEMSKLFPALRCAMSSSKTSSKSSDVKQENNWLNWHVLLFDAAPVSTIAALIQSASPLSTTPGHESPQIPAQVLTLDFSGIPTTPADPSVNSPVVNPAVRPFCQSLKIAEDDRLRRAENGIFRMKAILRLALLYSPLSSKRPVELHIGYRHPINIIQALILVSNGGSHIRERPG
jgi:hypothetical protein